MQLQWKTRPIKPGANCAFYNPKRPLRVGSRVLSGQRGIFPLPSLIHFFCTGRSKKTVTSNFSLTDLKITKNGVTQSFLESLYPTIYASSTCLAVWATLGHFGPLWLFGPLWATLGHFGPFKHETG